MKTTTNKPTSIRLNQQDKINMAKILSYIQQIQPQYATKSSIIRYALQNTANEIQMIEKDATR